MPQTEAQMKTLYSLYNKSATFFDLISGDKEPKQTKGLAAVLSQDRQLIQDFLQHPAIDAAIINSTKSKLNHQRITFIEVASEAPTQGGQYVDMVIKVDVNNTPFIALVIEAKSIGVRAHIRNLANQINGYLLPGQISQISGYKAIGIVLTKHRIFIPGVQNILWEEIVQLLIAACSRAESPVTTQHYLTFLTGIDSMKYYEKDVLSVAAGATIGLVKVHKVYACPDTPRYNYKRTIFMAFRQRGGGVMTDLFRVVDVVTFNPLNHGELTAFRNSNYNAALKQQILDYISAAPPAGKPAAFANVSQRFYVLSHDTVPLPHNPHPARNNMGAWYFCLHDILTNTVVTPC